MAGSKKTNHGKKSGSSLRDGEGKIDFNRSTDQPTGTEREVFEKMWFYTEQFQHKFQRKKALKKKLKFWNNYEKYKCKKKNFVDSWNV